MLDDLGLFLNTLIAYLCCASKKVGKDKNKIAPI